MIHIIIGQDSERIEAFVLEHAEKREIRLWPEHRRSDRQQMQDAAEVLTNESHMIIATHSYTWVATAMLAVLKDLLSPANVEIIFLGDPGTDEDGRPYYYPPEIIHISAEGWMDNFPPGFMKGSHNVSSEIIRLRRLRQPEDAP